MSSPWSHVPTRPSRRRARRLAAPLTLLLLAASACGGDTEPTAAEPSTDASASASVSASATASPSGSASTSPSPQDTVSPSTSSGSGSGSGSTSGASPEDDDEPTATTAPAGQGPMGRPASDLLEAAELPGLNPRSPWTAQRTEAVGSDPFGVCSRFDALTLGAREGVERRFTATEATAAQQVLDFPDAQNASRAAQVLASWHRDCGRRLPGEGGNVRTREAVTVATGSAWWYLATWEEAGSGQVQTFGLALNDQRLTLLRMDHDGQDHNYPAGRDPLQRGLVAAATKMGG